MQAKRLTNTWEAAQLLRDGRLVAIPTETVYGLAAKGTDPLAVARIFEAKNRPFFDPLILHVGSLDQARALSSQWPDAAEQLAQTFWPGPLTLVVPKSTHVPDIVSSSLPNVGIRMPDHPVALDLLRALDFPLAAPSANPFGYVSPTTSEHVMDQLGGSIEAVLEGGPCAVGVESTIVKCDDSGIHLLRLGGISQEQIEAVIGPIVVSDSIEQGVQAPGQLEQHYSPHCKIELLEAGETPQGNANGAALVLFKPRKELDWNLLDLYALSNSGNPAEAAAGLFAALRMLDKKGYSKAYIEMAPKTGLGLAINDRLKRAAAKR